MPRRLAATALTGLLAAAFLTPAAAATAATAAPDPCAAVEDQREAGLCYFELAQTMEDCSPEWKRAMAKVLASGAIQFFVNPLEHCGPCGGERTVGHGILSGSHGNLPGTHGNLPGSHGNLSGTHGNLLANS
ncbi:hypothetical protein AB0B50_28030 [Streptomyces sp. NPDC041068]|uniref:hypothetical protein n=1 Tax=Streptomyces sp. NPDC041068 TaxID=3155130 RepID=UPI0033C131EC